MRYGVGGLRLALAILMFAAVTATYMGDVERNGHHPNPFNFFGFFTIQNNLLAATLLAISALLLFRGRRGPHWFHELRACAVTYIAIVGTVYAVLLAPIPVEGGIAVPWANNVEHYIAPIAVAIDWILFADRPALRWRRLWVVLPYPLIWIIVVLIRGATDGWVPYPFLEPENGFWSVLTVCVGICITLIVVHTLVTLISRIRIIPVPLPEGAATAPHSTPNRLAPEGASA